MAKVMFIGKTQIGKTTLIQALKQEELKYKKTQVVEFHTNIIDTPGEYMENPRYYSAIITMSFDADIIALVQDVSSEESYFPPGFGNMFNKKVIGVLTKIDMEHQNGNRSKEKLIEAGAREIYSVSAYDNIGIDALAKLLEI